MEDDDLCVKVRLVRHQLHVENKERFVNKEKPWNYEKNFIRAILDSRFELLNLNGSTKAMKKDAEKS